MTVDVEGIKARRAKITPGKWQWNHRYELHNTHVSVIESSGHEALNVTTADAEFIAAAPDDIDQLLSEHERLTQALGEIQMTRVMSGSMQAWQACLTLADQALNGEQIFPNSQKVAALQYDKEQYRAALKDIANIMEYGERNHRYAAIDAVLAAAHIEADPADTDRQEG